MNTIFEGEHVFVMERDGWEYVERKSATEAVAVLALTDDKHVILIEQQRKAVDARVIDFPAGLVGDGETKDPAETAKKELEEETGYVCERVELVVKGPTSPGITSELVSFYRAHGVTRKGDGGGVDGESIEVHVIALVDVRGWLEKKRRNGVLIDLKVWGGLYFLE